MQLVVHTDFSFDKFWPSTWPLHNYPLSKNKRWFLSINGFLKSLCTYTWYVFIDFLKGIWDRYMTKWRDMTKQRYNSLVCHCCTREEWCVWNIFFLPTVGIKPNPSGVVGQQITEYTMATHKKRSISRLLTSKSHFVLSMIEIINIKTSIIQFQKHECT